MSSNPPTNSAAAAAADTPGATQQPPPAAAAAANAASFGTPVVTMNAINQDPSHITVALPNNNHQSVLTMNAPAGAVLAATTTATVASVAAAAAASISANSANGINYHGSNSGSNYRTNSTATANGAGDDNFAATAALVAFLRMEADLADDRAKRLREQAASLARRFGVSDARQEAYELDPDQMPPLDENGIPKYKGKKRGRKPKNRKRRANPNRRKRQHTAYTLYVQETYPGIKAANPHLASKDVISIVAKQWKMELSAEQRNQWKERAVATHAEDIGVGEDGEGVGGVGGSSAGVGDVTGLEEEAAEAAAAASADDDAEEEEDEEDDDEDAGGDGDGASPDGTIPKVEDPNAGVEEHGGGILDVGNDDENDKSDQGSSSRRNKRPRK